MGVSDAWDANNDLYHVVQNFVLLRPELPGTVPGAQFILNLQNGDYAYVDGSTNQQVLPNYKHLPWSGLPDSMFDPQNMAAQAQY